MNMHANPPSKPTPDNPDGTLPQQPAETPPQPWRTPQQPDPGSLKHGSGPAAGAGGGGAERGR